MERLTSSCCRRSASCVALNAVSPGMVSSDPPPAPFDVVLRTVFKKTSTHRARNSSNNVNVPSPLQTSPSKAAAVAIIECMLHADGRGVHTTYTTLFSYKKSTLRYHGILPCSTMPLPVVYWRRRKNAAASPGPVCQGCTCSDLSPLATADRT